MRFRSFDTLRLFEVVARADSFTAAAASLNLTKGAVSYRIRTLEDELGFPVFVRGHRSIALTEKGKQLLQVSQSVFGELEREIAGLRDKETGDITVATSTYFASRWLSSRLMEFILAFPRTALRLLPLVDLMDLRKDRVDIAIRWGKGGWTDMESERLFACPAFPTAGACLARRIEEADLAAVLPDLTLLHDLDGSSAWSDWHSAAGLTYSPKHNPLVIPDPNVRVQAVINNQGVALNDALVADDLVARRLFQISPVTLDDYGYYLAYPKGPTNETGFTAFRDWIKEQAASWTGAM